MPAPTWISADLRFDEDPAVSIDRIRSSVPDPERVVVVTGGTGGLGQWVVRRFAEPGHRVFVPVREPMRREPQHRGPGKSGPGLGETMAPELSDEARSRITHRACDVTRSADVEDLIESVAEDAGGPDVVVHCVGGFAMASVEDTEPSEWDRMVALNATSAFLLSRTVLPGMKERRWGRIVHVASMPALRPGSPGMAAYGAAKAALVHLTRSTADEVVSHGITVNAVAPTVIDTPANRAADPGADPATWIHPSQIADIVAFLASDAGSVVTGAAIPLSKG